MSSMRTLVHGDERGAWKAVIPSWRTKSVVACAFRMTSAGGAVAFTLIQSEFCRYPGKLFALLLDHEKATDLLDDHRLRPCCLDPFSKKFMQHFGRTRQGLLSASSLAVLETVLLSMPVTTSTIEARHASAQRIKQSYGHTWSMNLEQLSARFLFKVQRSFHGSRGATVQKGKRACNRSRPGKRRKGGGGCWRICQEATQGFIRLCRPTCSAPARRSVPPPLTCRT